MHFDRSKFRFTAVMGLMLGALAPWASPAAAAWPEKAVRVVVPYAAGGGTDTIARVVAQKMSENLGQQFIVDNRPGAGGNVGSAIVAKAPGDGYTLLVGNPSPFSINKYLFKNMQYDPEKELTGIAVLIEYPNVFVVRPDLPAKTLKELIDYGKANPGKLNYGSGGNGSSGHLSMELFKSMVGIDAAHVPYKGSNPAMMDLLGSRVDMNLDTLTIYLGHIRSGKLRALAVSTAQRVDVLPEVPTIAEAGVPGYAAPSWFAMAAPATTPPDLIKRINEEVNKALRDSAVISRMESLAGKPVGGTAEETNAYFAKETVKWREIVRISGAVVNE